MEPTGKVLTKRVPAVAAELPALSRLRIVVAGEPILDRYLWGEVSRISPEAPIPVLRAVREETRLGNSGFVMGNLRAMGARVSALGTVGRDHNGRRLLAMLRGLGVKTRSLLADPDRPTIVKHRMLGSVQSANRATQQLLRVDEEDTRPVSAAVERALKQQLAVELRAADGLLISDLNKGLLTPGLLRALINGAHARRIPVIVDPALTDDFSIYRGATAITPNRYETERASGIRLFGAESWGRAAEKLIDKLDLKACLITLDREGMYLAERGGFRAHIATAPREVYDVTGAGDVVLALFGLFVAAGAGFGMAAALANVGAGLEVSRRGADIISREDLERALRPRHDGYRRKILPLDQLKAELARARASGRRVAFTNGCFDLLHAGHVQILSFARAQADLLVVGLNSDRSVRALKGERRPVYPAAERARILAALEDVDYVVVFDETRAERIIRAVRPDVLIKGEDWRGQTLDGQKFVESRGGRVVLAPLVAGKSTSATIESLAGPSRPRDNGRGRTRDA